MKKRLLTHAEIDQAASDVSGFLLEDSDILYPVPRGGVPAAYAVRRHKPRLRITSDIRKATAIIAIIDDITDSGSIRDNYAMTHPELEFYALFDKSQMGTDWIVFPWEVNESASAEDIGIRLLEYIGEDPTRGGLLETPERFLRAWREKTSGYAMEPADVLKVFEDGAADIDEMILVKDIPFNSSCEHHLERIWGLIHIGYVPNGKIVGLSKLYRVADIFARRLQVQERMTAQIADAIEQHLTPLGVGVIVEARHACMEARGIGKRAQVTVTSALRGVMKDKPEARAEFLALARGSKIL